ncbi:MAG: sulfotransferase [Pseudomonadota bacterium]
MKPVNLFVVGAAKCGTTSLASYLNQHESIFIPDIKEPKYFSIPENVFPHKGPGDEVVDLNVVASLEDYNALYRGQECSQYLCDASVDYLMFDNVPVRIFDYCPDAKIIIMLRNPVDRAYSAYMHMIRDGREYLSFEDAIKLENKRAEENWEFFWKYIECGMYSKQVERYLNIFPEKNIKVVLFDDFINDANKVLNEISGFLEIERKDYNVSRVLNVSGVPSNKALHNLLNNKNFIKKFFRKYIPVSLKEKIKYIVSSKNIKKVKISDSVRKDLVMCFRDDVSKLSLILGRDLNGLWK